MGDVVRIDRRVVAKPDETVSDHDRLLRLARVANSCGDMRKDAYVASYATEDGGAAGITYGDIAALVRIYLDRDEQLSRIETWHSREAGPAGMVGDNCNECGLPWPCDTRLMATGQYVDPAHYEAEGDDHA